MKLQSCILTICLLAPVASALGPGGPKSKAPMTKVESFKWTDPFANRKYKRFTPTCESTKTFRAHEYELHDLNIEPPLGLWPFDEALKKVFKTREYPGSWGGWDQHQYDRNLLMMEYWDLPIRVREWIEDQERNDGEGKGLFAVYTKPAEGNKVYNTVTPPSLEKVAGLRPLDKKKLVFFAPAALYTVLPLFVAEDSICEGTLGNLDNYSSKLVDKGVVAWPISYTNADRNNEKRDVEFTIKAQVLKAKEEEKDEL